MDHIYEFLMQNIKTREDFNTVYAMLSDLSKHLDRKAIRSLSVGDRVTYAGNNSTFTGTVTKVNRSRVHVRTDGGKVWSVSAGSLKKVA